MSGVRAIGVWSADRGTNLFRLALTGCGLGVASGLPIVIAEVLLVELRFSGLTPSPWERLVTFAVIFSLVLWPAAAVGAVGNMATGLAGVERLLRWLSPAAAPMMLGGATLALLALVVTSIVVPAALEIDLARRLALMGAWLATFAFVLRQELRRREITLVPGTWMAGSPAGGVPRWLANRGAAVVVALLLWGSVFVVVRWDEAPNSRAATFEYGPISGAVAAALVTISDRDGDGQSSLFGGGDCDDGDAAVHQGAAEVAGNDIDEDCDGVDLPLSFVVNVSRQTQSRALRRGKLRADEVERAAPAVATIPRPNIVHVLIDTVRADRVTKRTMPNLLEFASEGVRFERAYAQGPKTKASVASLLTGKYFSEVRRSLDQFTRVHDANVTFVEQLQEAGYDTTCVMSHRYLAASRGYAQGCDRFANIAQGADPRREWFADEVVEIGLRKLDAREPGDPPSYLLLHIIDPHHPYSAHPSTRVRYDADKLARYDAELKWVDAQLARLTAALPDNTLLVVHADHGEAFGEHGNNYHGQALYEEQVRVPLILVGPGIKPARHKTPVMVLDLHPTILTFAQVAENTPASETPIGRPLDLTPYLRDGKAPADRPVFAEMVPDVRGTRQIAVVEDGHKLIHNQTLGTFALFDLTADPGEERNLLSERPEKAAKLRATLRTFTANLETWP